MMPVSAAAFAEGGEGGEGGEGPLLSPSKLPDSFVHEPMPFTITHVDAWRQTPPLPFTGGRQSQPANQ